MLLIIYVELKKSTVMGNLNKVVKTFKLFKSKQCGHIRTEIKVFL